MLSSESNVTLKNDVNLVEQILRQGQRLRNSMVRTILDNDPFSEEYKANCTPSSEKDDISVEEKHKFLAYLRGERMTRDEEKKVLETFREMSDRDVADLTERSYRSDYSCNCETCQEYYKHRSSCDFNHSKSVLCSNRERLRVPNLNLSEQRKHEFTECLKYVDCLKVSVHSVVLNQEGIKNIYGPNTNKNINMPLVFNHMYFLEYKIPSVISKCDKSKSKVDSGLGSKNFVRICSRKLQGEAILFKQTSLHQIKNLDEINLSTIGIHFIVSSRTSRQKNTNVIGTAKFNMNLFLDNYTFSITQGVLLMLDLDAPIVIGKVKVHLELGCGESHFGDEFFKAIQSGREKEMREIQHVNTEVFSDDDYEREELEIADKTKVMLNSGRDSQNREVLKENVIRKVHKYSPKKSPKNLQNKEEDKDMCRSENKELLTTKIENVSTLIYNNQVLFGFVCILQGHFEENFNTFVSYNPFCKYDTVFSSVVAQCQTPYYNFQQVLPFVYDESFLNCLRDNFMIFEFWNKSEPDRVIGIAKINLHPFYISFRNPVITKYLQRNELPVLGCDGWETICDPLSSEIRGKCQILVALGTEEQISNLRVKRGFLNDTVTIKPKDQKIQIEPTKKITVIPQNNKKTVPKPKAKKPIKIKQIETTEIGIQSDLNQNQSKMDDNNTPIESNDFRQNYSSITSFLRNLIETNSKSYVENSTNTETVLNNPQVAKTSDLLDTLQKALEVPKPKTTFKAHIFIDGALHLPFRKKSKTKKSRGKGNKYDEILPSTYVSFETVNEDVQLTPVVQKNKNPVWGFDCDVELPTDLLTNSEKRLIFKVWKKSNATIHPNMEMDTIIGFAGLDLTILTVGMPSVSGWFNILDFSNKCNGQIKVTVTPQETVKRNHSNQKPVDSNKPPFSNSEKLLSDPTQTETFDEPSELLSRALKRKFTELDEITQRLRLRLSHVTNDESDVSNDEFADEFERDINTQCEGDIDIEEFDTDFHQEDKSNSSYSAKVVSSLDRNLVEGRLKLDSLFEKLALLTNNDPTQAFNSRHISGCSTSQDQDERILGNQPSDGSSSSTSELTIVEGIKRIPDGSATK